jgi:hypothetical protein
MAEGSRGDGRAQQRAAVERLLAEIAEATARADDARAAAQDCLADAGDKDDGHLKLAARERAKAADERTPRGTRSRRPSGGRAVRRPARSLAAAALARARSREQRGLAEQARAAVSAASGDPAAIEQARADMHDAWAAMQASRTRAREAEGEEDSASAAADAVAESLEEQARAAAERLDAAEHRAEANEERLEEEIAEEIGQRRAEAARRPALAEDRARGRARGRRGAGASVSAGVCDATAPGLTASPHRGKPGRSRTDGD